MRLVKHYFFIVSITILLSMLFTRSSIALAAINEAIIKVPEEMTSGEFYIDLDGEWQFFQKLFIHPSEWQKSDILDSGISVSIPNSFETHTGEINSYGTYTTKINIPDQYLNQTLAIYIPFQYSAYIFYVNETEVARNGAIGQNSIVHHSEMAPRTGYFIATENELQLTMLISSFEHIRGGFENSIYIGEATVVTQKFNSKMLGTLFLNGCIFIIGLFMMLFALYRRQERLFLIFGIFAMLISFRALFEVPFYYKLLFIDMSWLWGTRWEYILTEATSMLFIILIWKGHEAYFSKKIMGVIVAIHLALIAVTFCTQPVFFQNLFFKVFMLSVPILIYVIYVIIKSIKGQNQYAKINLYGMTAIFIAFFNDYAVGQNWYQFRTLMLPAVGFYVLLHVFLMSKNYAESTYRMEQQNKQLLALNASNEKLAVQLQKEIKRKDEFLANTSHELKNPLHGIMNITQSLLRNRANALNKRTRDDLGLLLKISRHMSRTLEDLMDISRLREHKIQLHKERLDLQAIALGVADMLNMFIDNGNVALRVNIPADFPNIVADKNRLIQILFNLLHNATKYTKYGSITVSAEIKHNKVLIHVTDTGIGITEQTLQHIFDAYEQGEDVERIARVGGFGLGLSIAKQLVEMHKGTITVESIVNEGSTFTITLPFGDDDGAYSQEAQSIYSDVRNDVNERVLQNIPEAIDSANMSSLDHNPTSYRPKILVVDDIPINLQVITNVLTEDEYDLVTVTSGIEALSLLEREKWDLVISDVMMPGMSGYELTKRIRENYSRSQLPILLLTSRNQIDDISAGFISGANDYVTKPVDAIELNVRVRALADLQTSIRERLWMEAAWLHAQIRPHFLLNTINTIVSLSEFDTQRMARLLEKFSVYLQTSFTAKNLDEVVPLKSELELLEAYLFIEKERFDDRLQIKYEIDDTQGIMIPPLTIQTLVENAVNHGVLKRSTGGLVTIKIRNHIDYTEVTIIDDGVGMDSDELQKLFIIQTNRKHGIGIMNTDRRLKRLYGKGLQIYSQVNIGTTVTFEIPRRLIS